jgi:cyclophilin family peptidyl-prolyl cis-trans isomerase
MTIDPKKTYVATMKTSCGTVTVNLLASQAPQTVNSFVFLAQQHFYDGLTFHRVFAGFGGPSTNMIQGGDPKGTGGGGPGYQIKNENAIAFSKPYLAMANSGPDSNGSQFFLLDGPWTGGNPATCGKNPSSQGCYSVFGTATGGLDVIKRIAQVPGTPIPGGAGGNTPNVPIKIISVTIAVA